MTIDPWHTEPEGWGRSGGDGRLVAHVWRAAGGRREDGPTYRWTVWTLDGEEVGHGRAGVPQVARDRCDEVLAAHGMHGPPVGLWLGDERQHAASPLVGAVAGLVHERNWLWHWSAYGLDGMAEGWRETESDARADCDTALRRMGYWLGGPTGGVG